MKIAVLSLQLPSPRRSKTGGVAYVAHRLANALSDRGHQLTVFSTDERPADAHYNAHLVPSAFSTNVARNWLENWRVARHFAAQDMSEFDVVHAHGDDALVWRPGPPVVRTLHGAALAEAIHAPTWRRRLWYLSFAPREVWEAAKADVTVAVSASTRRWIPMVDRVIPNFFDESVFHTGTERATQPTILFVGTLDGRKRGQLLVDLFQSQIRPAIPSARLWLVAERALEGPGITSYLQPDDETLADLYRRAWAFCLPSKYEGFGVPYVEAMASGTPVVATPNPGALEVLDQGKWGAIVPPSELGSILTALLNDEESRQHWSLRGVERAEDFTLDAVVDAYETLFREAIERHGKQRANG